MRKKSDEREKEIQHWARFKIRSSGEAHGGEGILRGGNSVSNSYARLHFLTQTNAKEH